MRARTPTDASGRETRGYLLAVPPERKGASQLQNHGKAYAFPRRSSLAREDGERSRVDGNHDPGSRPRAARNPTWGGAERQGFSLGSSRAEPGASP